MARKTTWADLRGEMARNYVTVTDVAGDLGISRVILSAWLNTPGFPTPEWEQKIRTVITKLGEKAVQVP